MNALIGMGFAKIIGSALGGVISDMISIKQVFLYTSTISFVAALVFGTVFLLNQKTDETKLLNN